MSEWQMFRFDLIKSALTLTNISWLFYALQHEVWKTTKLSNFCLKVIAIRQNSLVIVSLWVMATVIKALSFENIVSLCLRDLSPSVRHYGKSSNFTKLLRVFFDLKNFILSSPWFWKWILQEEIMLFHVE